MIKLIEDCLPHDMKRLWIRETCIKGKVNGELYVKFLEEQRWCLEYSFNDRKDVIAGGILHVGEQIQNGCTGIIGQKLQKARLIMGPNSFASK